MKTFTQHIITEAKPKANGKSFKWNKEEHPPLKKGTITIQMEFMGWEKDGELASWQDESDPKYNAKGVEKRFKLKLKFKRDTKNGSMWDITGKTEDVFFYITTEYQGNSEKGNESPGSDIGVEMIKALNPNMYEGVKEAVNPTSYVSREGKKIIQKYKKEIKAANKAKNLAIAFDKLGDAAYQAIGNMLSNDGSIKTDDPDEWDKEIGDWVSFVKV